MNGKRPMFTSLEVHGYHPIVVDAGNPDRPKDPYEDLYDCDFLLGWSSEVDWSTWGPPSSPYRTPIRMWL